MTDNVLNVENLTMHYTTRAGEVSAVNNVSFSLEKGKSMGLVGESGCGKTSIAISLLKLLPDNAVIKGGHIYLNSTDVVPLTEEQMCDLRWDKISMVFQAAMNALDPVYKVGDQIIEAMEVHGQVTTYAAAREHVASIYELVGLDPPLMDQYPHEYSGGMRQRAIIAMALVCSPDIIIADEPTTALDVIVQDSLLRELVELQDKLNMSMIYISHDVAVIAEVTERVGVMYAGRMAEFASGAEIFKHPLHPYTYGLLSAFPSIVGPKRELTTLPGEPPDLISPPPGCRYHPRCPYATEICSQEVPKFRDMSGDRFVACWHPLEGN